MTVRLVLYGTPLPPGLESGSVRQLTFHTRKRSNDELAARRALRYLLSHGDGHANAANGDRSATPRLDAWLAGEPFISWNREAQESPPAGIRSSPNVTAIEIRNLPDLATGCRGATAWPALLHPGAGEVGEQGPSGGDQWGKPLPLRLQFTYSAD